MHPPEPAYPCYLPVLGEFSRMTPHEGLQTIVAEFGGRLESGRWPQLPDDGVGDGDGDAGDEGEAGAAFAGAFWIACATFWTAAP